VKLSASYNLKFINPEIANQWHPIKNGELTPDMVTPYSGKKVWWVCENGHEWQAVIANRKRGRGCPFLCQVKNIVILLCILFGHSQTRGVFEFKLMKFFFKKKNPCRSP
jgi:hypothetical protein